ncbi:metallophosphoesterase [Flavobacterium amnicola]|uniref:Metallophosphoesterase n=1 Tax=Flavobacterium amnicola TaxID=2506422 RepID=A0A4Q1K436_9FLAO|nr:metallophosphoesterase [Flavobacterium amnicola]RXR20593.1 metallophosphoesterase [Flavobacterium amnicola]
MILRFIILASILFFVEIYAFQAFRTLLRSKWFLWAYVVISLLLYVYIFYTIFNFDRKVGQTKNSLFALGLLLTVYLPKIVLATIMFGEDVFRLLSGVTNYFIEYDNRESFFPSRRRFVSQVALGLAAIPFLSLIYGVTKGKYNYKVIKQNLFFPDLPDAFDGFTITHISDIHSGSFDNAEKINYAVDLINEQQSDILLFTGDIVNAKAEEMHPWIETFNRLTKPAFGKYSILGNHDYGAYLDWNSEEEKAKNFEEIKDLHRQIDFKLLLNEHVKIKKDNQEIALVGVENWGKHFGSMGDINKAADGLTKEDFKVVMSHDPSHWEEIVKHHEKHFHLTLSGHTHGMQFGIEIPGYFKWSLAQYMYKQWAGCYEHLGKYVYVNRGFGFHAYPGRVGIMPEITVIRLKKGQNIA